MGLSSAHRPSLEKQPHDIDLMLRLIRDAVKDYPKAALFELYAEGFISPFEQLVACMISIRTRDEVTLPTARRLFGRARTPTEILALPAATLDWLIRPCTFHEAKTRQIREIATQLVRDHGGELPCDRDLLLSLKGVGPKTAHLVLGIACGVPGIGVDIHVHRVTNRWGYVHAATPENTLGELEKKLPHDYWVELNALLVPFGKNVCTGTLPRCSTCPVLSMCQQVGVRAHR